MQCTRSPTSNRLIWFVQAWLLTGERGLWSEQIFMKWIWYINYVHRREMGSPGWQIICAYYRVTRMERQRGRDEKLHLWVDDEIIWLKNIYIRFPEIQQQPFWWCPLGNRGLLLGFCISFLKLFNTRLALCLTRILYHGIQRWHNGFLWNNGIWVCVFLNNFEFLNRF